ncbi:hypothetical protein I350_00477 [Cryptococcus amylolentus CBS 6273]|uniref:Myb/SANT-like domain-containing protein n=1 Tax=Cryptococcus amylolentus CBS 6273 TaxID=1296118 RepID=A0A1E3KFM0_9TREE|nr:hypothetical protein I350_00477 [Cryptococcus amylolentus CBS 6273]
MSAPQHPPPSATKQQPATKKKKTKETKSPDVASVTPATASPTPGAPGTSGTPGVAAAASAAVAAEEEKRTQDWSNNETLVMLRELVDRRLAQGSYIKTWQKKTLDAVAAKIHQQVAGTVLRTDKSLRGKINTLRKDYKLIATLLNDFSGFGWNGELKCVYHEDDVWYRKLTLIDPSPQVSAKYRKFQVLRWPFYDLMLQLEEGGAEPTGEQVFDPLSDTEPVLSWSASERGKGVEQAVGAEQSEREVRAERATPLRSALASSTSTSASSTSAVAATAKEGSASRGSTGGMVDKKANAKPPTATSSRQKSKSKASSKAHGFQAQVDMAENLKQEREARAAAKVQAANAARKEKKQEKELALNEVKNFLEGLVDRGVLTLDQLGAIFCVATKPGGPWVALQSAAKWGGVTGDIIIRNMAKEYAPELPSSESPSGWRAPSTPYGGGSYGHTGCPGNGRMSSDLFKTSSSYSLQSSPLVRGSSRAWDASPGLRQSGA